MAVNIFNEKQDYIVAARDEVIKRDEYAANIDRMKQQQKKQMYYSSQEVCREPIH